MFGKVEKLRDLNERLGCEISDEPQELRLALRAS